MIAAQPLPLDVKVMNLTATALLGTFALLVLAAAVNAVIRHPYFSIAGIAVQGDMNHSSAATLRANVAPRLSGGFFTIDLARARAVFESVPWVRSAVVRREFPNRLRVVLQEHQPVAYWGAEGDTRLVNSFGEVFEANVDDVEQQGLPRLSGPQGQAPQILATYRALAPVFESLDLSLDQLELSGRGGWRATLDTGAVIELGRGDQDEVMARTRRFVGTLTQVASRYGRRAESMESADLRHSEGYALRLRGVNTVVSPTAGKK